IIVDPSISRDPSSLPQPQIHGLLPCGRGEWELDFAAGPSSLIASEEDLQDGATVFATHTRPSAVGDAVRKVLELAGVPRVEELLEHGEGPSPCGVGLLDRIAVAALAVGEDRVSAQEVGVGHAL